MSRSPLPDILRVSPTAIDNFAFCPRRYLNQQVLGIPASDAGPANDHGLRTHELLRFVHERGTCHDAQHVTDVLQAHGADADALRTMFERHRQRCPRVFDEQAHEVERARYFHRAGAYFMATARVDAIWVHDGIFDVRDYKTGTRRVEELRDDLAARVQAWVWAPRAAVRGARLRLRYEYLAPEVEHDPDPWEPDDDDLEAIGEQLAATVATIRTSEFAGVNEQTACRVCPYRSICPDSATPGEPVWPVLGFNLDEQVNG